MHSACGTMAAASLSGMGDSIAQGDEKSAVKNTAPDRRTTRRTSDSTSILGLWDRRSGGQGFQSLNQGVKRIRCLGQEARRASHWFAPALRAAWSMEIDGRHFGATRGGYN